MPNLLDVTGVTQKQLKSITEKYSSRGMRHKKKKKRDSFSIDIEKYNLDRIIIQGKELYKNYNYISEMSPSAAYEIITGKIGCELGGFKYESKVIDACLKDKTLKLVSYVKDGDIYNPSDEREYTYSMTLFSEEKDLAIQIISKKTGVFFTFCSNDLIGMNEYAQEFDKYVCKKTICEIGLFFQDKTGTDIRKVSIDPVKVDVALNYGKKFAEKHDVIVQKLEGKKSGLYIFHGPPAGGKTSYIKYLSQLVNRMFVFIPTGLVDSIDSPALVSVLLQYETPVLILEDAEKAITSRESNSNPSLVSTLLNLSDGILSSMLGVSLIVTFNVGRENIDKALVRKGRLMVEHEFGELNIEESNKLAKKLKKDVEFTEPQMLGNIYNYEDNNFHEEKEEQKIGFLAGQ